MLPTGHRMIDGREYVLAGRVTGDTPEAAKKSAEDEAKRIRDRGQKARIVKTCSIDYKIYQH
jgi:hypothetical protein